MGLFTDRISRRQFLKLSAGMAASAPLLRLPILGSGQGTRPFRGTHAQTTLDRTIVKGSLVGSGSQGSYYGLAYGPGEPYIVRTDLSPASTGKIEWALPFVQFTDIHLVDAQSPARVEFLDRYADQQCETFPLNGAFRPQETLTLQVLEAMIEQIRALKKGPGTGAPFAFAVCTGDNMDNEQYNELRWFIDLMDGGKSVVPNSGDPTRYEGVQAQGWGDPEYWHPDPVSDNYKTQFGFPDYPGLLADAIGTFVATGMGLPWWQTFGNHDGLLQGNAPRNEAFNAIAVGGLKFDAMPPGADPCLFLFQPQYWTPTRPVTADPNRWIARRSDYVEEFFNTTGRPSGHGFSGTNLSNGTAYYVRDDYRNFRFISLDTVNPGGYADGSVGAAQFAWLQQRLIEVHSYYFDQLGNKVITGNKDRLVVLLSHHGLRSLNNPNQDPNPDDPSSNDLPRIMADQVEALLHQFPNVIAWVNGHTHDNVIQPRPDPAGLTAGFWDIGTAAHIDWPCQCRTVEVAYRHGGSLSIFCTIVDHSAAANPAGATGAARLAAIHRELAANDPQYGFDGPGPGTTTDRNVELLLPAPAWLK